MVYSGYAYQQKMILGVPLFSETAIYMFILYVWHRMAVSQSCVFGSDPGIIMILNRAL